ncbi:hypothetical protein [uncultured Dysgonomonas sp.]|uniref:hypothetical protein n=1 Tax=uncultured Dysgonomonas sp. TaxID=206096 RepID=UPI0026027410|nr:hypothetical protein [uncultured Dysgonomonas sp.]
MKDILSSLLTFVHPAPTFFDHGFSSQAEKEMFDRQAMHIVKMAHSCISHPQLNSVDRYFMQNLYHPFRFKQTQYIQTTLKSLAETIGFVRGQINIRFVNAQMAIDQNEIICSQNLKTHS